MHLQSCNKSIIVFIFINSVYSLIYSCIHLFVYVCLNAHIM